MEKPTPQEIENLYQKLKRQAQSSGYHLNPDDEITKALVDGLLVNEQRYGYQACPCRRAQGIKEEDLDIICPCDYRDPDLNQYGTCYCSLYVSKEVVEGKNSIRSIPERRPTKEERKHMAEEKKEQIVRGSSLSYPVWRCKVCGYLCARQQPPEVCPICKASRERFEIFIKN
jgi:ferredoxin-thioredoxin reductase catalytic chain